MKFTQRLSLRVRLTLIFLILASVTWLLSSFVAWKQTTDNVDELFDTQLMLFAKRLSTLDLNEINAADRMAQTPNRLKHGHVDDDALTFAIFTHDGRMVLNDGDNGEDIPYSYQREGFADGQLVGEDDPWRFVWMTSPDGKYRIVVGQEWEYREDMALAIVAGQLIPWLVALPIMLIIMMVLLGRELAPLNKLALALRMRDHVIVSPQTVQVKGENGNLVITPDGNVMYNGKQYSLNAAQREQAKDYQAELRSTLPWIDEGAKSRVEKARIALDKIIVQEMGESSKMRSRLTKLDAQLKEQMNRIIETRSDGLTFHYKAIDQVRAEGQQLVNQAMGGILQDSINEMGAKAVLKSGGNPLQNVLGSLGGLQSSIQTEWKKQEKDFQQFGKDVCSRVVTLEDSRKALVGNLK